jgi:hypothetical protein
MLSTLSLEQIRRRVESAEFELINPQPGDLAFLDQTVHYFKLLEDWRSQRDDLWNPWNCPWEVLHSVAVDSFGLGTGRGIVRAARLFHEYKWRGYHIQTLIAIKGVAAVMNEIRMDPLTGNFEQNSALYVDWPGISDELVRCLRICRKCSSSCKTYEPF